MLIEEIISERGEFTMKLNSKNASDYFGSEGKTSDSPAETRNRQKKIASRYDVNIVDDYDEYVHSGEKPTDGEVSPLTNKPHA